MRPLLFTRWQRYEEVNRLGNFSSTSRVAGNAPKRLQALHYQLSEGNIGVPLEQSR